MTFFESLLLLLLASIVLTQVARRLRLPYPALLAGAGVVFGFLPHAPNVPLEPETALALFIAPAVIDAAYDFPLGAARRFWVPLVFMAVVAVLVTTGCVAFLGIKLFGLPLAAAVVLGAIVSPPDAAAANAVLSTVVIPRSTDAVLKGESLFNDATALLLFGIALSLQTHGAFGPSTTFTLLVAVPGGILLGYLASLLTRQINRLTGDTVGANILQFVNTWLLWIVAARLSVSPILATVTFAMSLARAPDVGSSVRMRVQSFAVWRAVIFVLNVFAFMVMGLQARTIVAHMPHEKLGAALAFAGWTTLAVLVTRMVVVVAFDRVSFWRSRRLGEEPRATLAQAIFAGWCGMRGLVTLATAFALPANFPERDTVVLTAFSVVIATLVIVGLTLRPLVKILKLDTQSGGDDTIVAARLKLADKALAQLDGKRGAEADHLRFTYRVGREAAATDGDAAAFDTRRSLGLKAIAAEREELERMHVDFTIGIDAYYELQEEIDWRELTLLRSEESRIEEI